MMKRQAQFRPCIDLHDGRVKQIVGGTLEGADGGLKTNFVAEHDSAYFARMYARDGLTGGHVIKLGPGNDDAARSALEAAPGLLQLGGDVTDENAAYWLEHGAEKVIVTSFVFADGELKRDRLSHLSKAVGREHLTLDLSCRWRDGEYRVVTDRWRNFSILPVNASVLNDLAEFASEYLIHAVDVEGKRCGIDARLLNLLADGSPIPCVYAGGVANLDDISTIEREGGGRIDYTVGSALDIFGGSIRYTDLVERSHRERA